MTHYLYATTNPAKFAEASSLAASTGLTILSPSDLGLGHAVAETGTTLSENSLLKAQSYRLLVPDDVAIIGDDTGLFIDALGGEPGIYVRRFLDHQTELSDSEVIAACLTKMAGKVGAERHATMRTSLTVLTATSQREFVGELAGQITTEAAVQLVPNFPLETIFWASDYGLLLQEIHQLSLADRLGRGILTHREKAWRQAIDYLQTIENLPR